ncbi:hypothetical protein D3C81_1726020 [compost metagenome]
MPNTSGAKSLMILVNILLRVFHNSASTPDPSLILNVIKFNLYVGIGAAIATVEKSLSPSAFLAFTANTYSLPIVRPVAVNAASVTSVPTRSQSAGFSGAAEPSYWYTS